MPAARRPGRAQKIAYDATPLDARHPDVDARIGWLLAMSRLHHRNPDFADGSRFVEELGAAGHVASRSLVSRWESGEIPVPYEGLSAYERVLGLPTGTLGSLTGYLRAAVPQLRARVARPQLDPASRGFGRRLDELIQLAEDGNATPGDWQDLGWHLAAVPMVHLRASTWEAVTWRVICEVPRSVKVAYRQYSIAAMNIAAVQRAQDFLTEAVDRYVHTPGVQVLTNPVGFLDRLTTRRAAEMVLELVERPPTRRVYRVAIWVASQKLLRGDFTQEERTRLELLVLDRWRRDPQRAADELAEVIAALPEGLRSTFTEAARRDGRARLHHTVANAETLPTDTARSVSHNIAEAARTAVPGEPVYDEDRMLARLVREGLFHRDSERRHLAALLLTASPFAEAVGDQLLTLLGAASVPVVVRRRAAVLLRYLVTDAHRLRMLRLLDDPVEEVAIAVAQGLGHVPYRALSDQVLRKSLERTWSEVQWARMYALGMTGSPGLAGLARSGTAPSWQREAAGWWLDAGSAIHA